MQEMINQMQQMKSHPVVGRFKLFPLLCDFRILHSIAPQFVDDLHGMPIPAFRKQVAAFGEKLGLHVLDLLPAFEGNDGPELWVHPQNQHPNEVAHRIAATAIAKDLKAHAATLLKTE